MSEAAWIGGAAPVDGRTAGRVGTVTRACQLQLGRPFSMQPQIRSLVLEFETAGHIVVAEATQALI
jgi:hypothetical protein